MTPMDGRILAILKTLAYGEVGSNDMGDSVCLYCDYILYAKSDDEQGLHEPACPVRVARALLKEQGTPLLLFRVDYEQRNAYNVHGWYSHHLTRLAFDEQEALHGFETSPNPDDLRDWKRRNAKATLIREVR